MPFKRWDPLQDLISLHQDLFGEQAQMGLAGRPRAAWTPPIDIFETDQAFILMVEIPGVDPEKVKIEYQERTLIISGDRPPPPRDARSKYHHVERAYGPFERRFAFPYLVCCEDIEAHYENGVIEINVPKDPAYKAKSVQVQGN